MEGFNLPCFMSCRFSAVCKSAEVPTRKESAWSVKRCDSVRQSMTATCTAPLVTPEFPSKLIVNIIKQTIQTENCSLWRLPRLGDAPFGTSPSPAFTICGFELELDTLQSIPPRRFITYLAGSGRPTRGAHRLSCCLLALCSSHPGRCRPYLQKNWCVANLNAPLWYAARMWIPPIKR